MKLRLVEETLNEEKEEDNLIENFNLHFETIGHYDPELDLVVFTKEEMEDWD